MPSNEAIASVREWYERQGFESKGDNIDEGPYIGMLADLLDAYAATHSLAAAEAMREMAAVACKPQHDGHCVLCNECRTRRHLQDAIRAIPLQETKQ